MRDSNSCLVQAFLESHTLMNCCKLANFFSGSRSFIASVYISIPRNVKQVVGPSTFSGARGTPSEVHTSEMIVWLRAQSEVPGFPSVTKSSKL